MVKLFPFWPTGQSTTDAEPAQSVREQMAAEEFVTDTPPETATTALVTTDQGFIAPQLGDRVRDPITGFEGVVTMMALFLNGCIRVGVQAEKMHEGKPITEMHFDQGQVRVVERGVHKPLVTAVQEAPSTPARRASGGPPRPVTRASVGR